MDCEKARGQIADYLVGALDEEARQALEAHVAGCAGCRAELEAWRREDEAIRAGLRWAEPQPDFALRVVVAARRRRPWWIAAAAAVAACVAFWLLRPAESPPTQRQAIPAATLAAGELLDFFGRPVPSLRPGRSYVAAVNTAVETPSGSYYLLPRGTEFIPGCEAKTELCVYSGGLLGQVEAGRCGGPHRLLTVLLRGSIARAPVAKRRTARRRGGASPRLRRLARPERRRTTADPDRRGLCDSLGRGVGGGDAPVAGPRPATSPGGERRNPRPTARRLYRRLVEWYGRRLGQLRAATRRDPLWPERVALVSQLLRAHARTLEAIQSHPALRELEAVEKELRRHEALECEALEAFGSVALALGE